MKMSFSIATKVFIISTLGVPITYLINTFYISMNITDSSFMLLSILIIMSLMLLATFYTTKAELSTQKRHERLEFYLFSVSSFMSVISLITALELDGIISGFMSAFLKHGEPHLRSSFGTMICYWNGIISYAMYLMMIAAITWANDFYDVLEFWFGSTLNCMLVLILGILTGKSGPNLISCILYLPFLFIPPITIRKMFKHNQISRDYSSHQLSYDNRGILSRHKDIFLMLLVFICILISLIRGIAVLTTNQSNIFYSYITIYEPYLTLKDPAPFGRIQMLMHLFYSIPIHIITMHSLIHPSSSSPFISHLLLIHAGASVHSQIIHIGSSFHTRTPYILRVPQENSILFIFCFVNLILLIVPIILTYRFSNASKEFVSTMNGEKMKHDHD